MNFEEFEDKYLELLPDRDPRIRSGQFLMNFLAEVWREEYNRISSVHFYDRTDIDCFYNDRLVPNTLKHLKSVWNDYPN